MPSRIRRVRFQRPATLLRRDAAFSSIEHQPYLLIQRLSMLLGARPFGQLYRDGHYLDADRRPFSGRADLIEGSVGQTGKGDGLAENPHAGQDIAATKLSRETEKPHPVIEAFETR